MTIYPNQSKEEEIISYNISIIGQSIHEVGEIVDKGISIVDSR